MCGTTSRRQLDIRHQQIQPRKFSLGCVCSILTSGPRRVGDGGREQDFRLDAADDGGVADANDGAAGAVGEGGGGAVGLAEGG